MHDFFFYSGLVLRIYPSDKQKDLIRRNSRASQFVYNRLVSVNREMYHLKQTAELSCADRDRLEYLKEAYKDARHLKNAVPFLYEKGIDSDMVLNAFLAYQNAWNQYRKVPGTRPPQLHKRSNEYSYKTSNHYTGEAMKNGLGLYEGSIRFIDHSHLHLPILGNVRFKGSKKIMESLFSRVDVTRIGSARIMIDSCGDCYVSMSLASDYPFAAYYPKTDSVCGIDLNLTNFMTCSDGTVIDNPRYLKRSEEKLLKLQRRLSKKKKRADRENRVFYESKRYQEERIRLSKQHRKVTRQRQNFHRIEADRLVKSHDLISAEDLRVKNLLKNHKLAKAISDAGWRSFLNVLKWDCDKRGKELIMIDPANTTQTCHVCGNIMKGDDRIRLGTDEWVCPNCLTFHLRDWNAAENIRDIGMIRFTEQTAAVSIA